VVSTLLSLGGLAVNAPANLMLPVARPFEPLLAPARNLAAWGGRASGKSYFFADRVISRSMGEKLDVVCIREVQRTLRTSVKKLLEERIAEHNVGYAFEVQDSRILTKLGGVIIFEGMQNQTSESIKSLQGFKVGWAEEAQTLSQRSIDMLVPTLRAPGSQLWWSWNPNLPTDPVDAYFRAEGEELPPDTVIVKALYHDNPWLSDESLADAEYMRRRDFERYLHIWEAEYESRSEARVFKNWTVEEFDTPPGTMFRFGADWGFSVDPSVLVRCWLDGRRLMVDYEAYMRGCEIDMLPDLFDTVPDAHKFFITADSSRPETISYMQKHGYPRMNRAVKGAGSLEEGVAFLQSYDIVVHPRCTHVIDELKAYKYKTDELTGKVMPLLEDKNNHVIDSLRYACEGVRRAAKAQGRINADDMRPTRSIM